MRPLRILLLAALLWTQGTAHAAVPVLLAEPQEHFALGRHLSLLEDRGGRWTLDDVRAPDQERRFVASRSDVPNLGYTDSYYWARFELANPLSHSQEFWLEMQPPWLQVIDLYVVHNDGTVEKQQGGLRQPSARQPIPNRHFLFPLTLAPEARQTVYARLKARSMQLNFTLWRPLVFLQAERQAQLFYGAYFGLIAVMAIYNLFLFFAVRLRVYLFCALYMLGAMFQQLTYRGFSTEYFGSNPAAWNLYGNLAFSGFTGFFALQFGKTFLQLRSHAPILNRLMTFLQAWAISTMVLPFFITRAFMSAYTAAMGSAMATLSLVAGAWVYRLGNKPARYYLLGWGVLQSSVVVHVLGQFAVLPLESIVVRHALVIGSALDVLLLSLALADQINVMRQEKEHAQSIALDAQRAHTDTLEHKVQERTAALERSMQVMRNFYNFIAHELRTPLTAIKAYLRFLDQGMRCEQPTPAQREHLEVLVRNSQRMLHLTHQLLDLARAESGMRPPTLAAVPVKPIVDRCLKQLLGLFAPEVSISLNIDATTEVLADEEHLDTIFLNLLSNAAKYTRSGNVQIQATTEGHQVTVAVVDSGIGIASSEVPELFKPFARLRGATRIEGTGLGLYICLQLLLQMGGGLEVDSKEGVGTTVSVRLPMALAQ